VTARSIARCEAATSRAAQERCFKRLAGSDDLSAQTALYSWAMLAKDQPEGASKALELLRRIQERFPKGLLAPEAALRELEILTRLRQNRDAAGRAAAFEARYPSHPRLDEVALLRASALCASAESRPQAYPVLARLARDASTPEVRKLARGLRSRCLPHAATKDPELGGEMRPRGPLEAGPGAPED
jgi:hypothetical protein